VVRDRLTANRLTPLSLDGFAFLNLHRNENTSVVAARAYVTIYGGRLLWLSQTGSAPERLITFTCMKASFVFDPNRMFTKEGAAASLTQYSVPGSVSQLAIDSVVAFGQAVLQAYRFDSEDLILAIHNNGGSNYSAASYLPGAAYAAEASKVSIPDPATQRNFFLVTSSANYNGLVEQGQNVVMQADNATNDGSLSYYAQVVRNKNYMNIEGAAANGSEGAAVALQIAQLVALRKAVSSETSQCAGYIAGVIVEAVVIAVLVVFSIALGVVIWRRRQQGYQAIDGMYSKY
jgi:hypothetical protein